MCKIASEWQVAVKHRELSLVLSDDGEGWDGGCRGALEEGIYVYIYTVVVQQELMQHCKATIL